MSWDQLLAILRQDAEERRADRAAPPVACPKDGEPLQSGPNGELHCPGGDYKWPQDQR